MGYFLLRLKLTITQSSQIIGFWRRRETGVSGEKLSVQSREPTNSTHIWRRIWESNPGHIGGRRVRHPCAIPALLTDRFWRLINVYALCKEDLCNVPSTPVSSFHHTTTDFYFLLKRVNLLLTTELCIIIISSQMHSIAFCAVTQIPFEAVYWRVCVTCVIVKFTRSNGLVINIFF